jgi:WD40 repeat protein
MQNTTSIQLPFTTSHAFIVGINDYQHLTPLRTAVNDARVMAKRLADQHGFTVHPPLLNATHQSLRKLLTEDIPKLVGEDDRVLFYFAGHGIALDGEEGPNGYLVAADTRPGKEGTLIPMQVLHDALTALPCRHGLLILDCCFSGAFKWSSGFRDVVFDLPKIIYEERFWRYCKDPAWQVITSSAYDQKAVDIITNQSLGLREAGNANHSPFAAALLKALGGAGDTVPPGGDGVMTATELYTYLRDSVETQTTENAKRQSPSIFNLRRHDKGEFIFLHPNHRFNLPPTPDRNPFMGLSSYNEEDASLFYGRDRVVETLLALVEKRSLVVVSGASGTGKSSVIKAGVLPALRQSGYHILPIIRPGKEPLQTILTELPDFDQQITKGPTVLVIDQYEELITQCLHQEERQAFEQKMADALSTYPDLRIVLSIRSDFEPQFESKILAPWWQAGRYVVPSFSLEEIREIITKPATQAVLFYEPEELVELLSEEVNQAPGALPLLSFTLSELYHKYLKSGREDRALIQQDYQELGGVVGALRTRADAEYLALNENEQSSMRKLMLRMVSLEGGELAGKRVYAEELQFSDPAETQRLQTIANRLVDVRLLVKSTDGQGRAYIEPAHDALVRAWGRLWEWIKTVGEEKIALQYKLNQAVNDYHGLLETELQKARNLLWNNNPRLDLLKAELQGKDHGFNAQEEAFVRSSVQRRSRRKRSAWGIAVAVMVGLASLSVFAFAQRNEAKDQTEIAKDALLKADQEAKNARIQADSALVAQKRAEHSDSLALLQADTARLERDNATAQTVIANERRLEAEAAARAAQNASLALTIAKTNPTLALRIADYNLKKHPGNSAAAAAFREVISDSSHFFYREIQGHTEEVSAVAFSPDGQRILTGSDDNQVKLWDLQSNLLQKFQGHSDGVKAVSFSPDGQRILTGCKDGTAKLWDLKGNVLKNFQGHSDGVTSVSFSPDEQRILTGSYDNMAKLWDLQGNVLQEFQGHSDCITSVSFSPNGQNILTGSLDGTARLWDLQGNVLQEFQGHSDFVQTVTFSPDGQTVLTGSFDDTVKLWDLQGNLLQNFQVRSNFVQAVTFSPDGQTILTGGGDGAAKLWDLQGNVLKKFQGHSDVVSSVSFSSDGQTILTGSSDNTVKLWDLQSNLLQNFQGHSDYVTSVSIPSTGKTILTGSWDYKVKLWDLQGNVLKNLQGHSSVIYTVAFSPDGQTILTGSSDNTVKLWDLKGSILQNFQGHSDGVNSVSFSPNGQTILTGSYDETAKLWDLQGNVLKNFQGHSSVIYTVAFSPDGQSILTGSLDGTVKLWDLQGNVLKNLQGHSDYITSVSFSPNGQTILTGSLDGTVKLWDLQGNVLKNLQGHSNGVKAVLFSPDGQRILTGNEDGTAKLWDLQGNVLQVFQGHSDGVTSISFSPNGQTILTGSYDETAKLWQMPQPFLEQKVKPFTLQELYDAGVILEAEDLNHVKEK